MTKYWNLTSPQRLLARRAARRGVLDDSDDINRGALDWLVINSVVTTMICLALVIYGIVLIDSGSGERASAPFIAVVAGIIVIWKLAIRHRRLQNGRQWDMRKKVHRHEQ